MYVPTVNKLDAGLPCKTQIANTVRSTQLGTDHTCGGGNLSLGVKGNQKFLQQQCHYEFLLY